MDTIDLTPTWATVAQICMLVLESDGSAEGKKEAREQLLQMAREIDKRRE